MSIIMVKEDGKRYTGATERDTERLKEAVNKGSFGIRQLDVCAVIAGKRGYDLSVAVDLSGHAICG